MRLSPRAIALCLVAVLILVTIMALLFALDALDARKDAARAKAGQTLADGRTAAAGDASAIRDKADARNDAITSTVKEGTDDVRQAPDRGSAARAARRGVCRVDPSASPDCRLLLADPVRVD